MSAQQRPVQIQAQLLVELLIGPPMSDEFRQRLQKIKDKYPQVPAPKLPPPEAAPEPAPRPPRDPRANWVNSLPPNLWTQFFGFGAGYGHGWDQYDKRVAIAHRDDFAEAWRAMERSTATFKVPKIGNWGIKMPWGSAIAGFGAQGHTVIGRTTAQPFPPENLIDNPYIDRRWNDEYDRHRAAF